MDNVKTHIEGSDVATSDNVSLKQYLLDIINEREDKYNQRFIGLDKSLADSHLAIAMALETANQTVRDVIATEKSLMNDLKISMDKRFDAIHEYHVQFIGAMATCVHKDDLDVALGNSEKAVLKAETATEKRFESVNEFRSQLADQQITLVRKSEVDLRFDSLNSKIDTAVFSVNSKIDTAVSQLQHAKGREGGMHLVWGVVAAIVGLILSAGTIVVTMLTMKK